MLDIAIGLALAIWVYIHSKYVEEQFGLIKKDLDYIKDKLDENPRL